MNRNAAYRHVQKVLERPFRTLDEAIGALRASSVAVFVAREEEYVDLELAGNRFHVPLRWPTPLELSLALTLDAE